ncbi:hypothetical protein GCM10025734_64810 [Kitasatospora paranensis]
MVAEGQHAAEAGADRRGVEHHHPLGGQMDLVDRRPGAEDGVHQGLRQPQRGDRHAVQLPLQGEEFAGGVVAEHHPVVAVQQHQALPDGVQGGLVVLVEVAELVGAHAVGVPAQPGVGEVGAETAEDERAGGDADQGEHRAAELPADRLNGDARADQGHHPAPVVPDGGDHPHGGAQGAGVRLVRGLAGQRPVDVAEEGPADLGGVAVRPADAVGVHHGDEVDPGVLPDPLGVRLDDGRGVGPQRGVADGGGVGDGGRGGGDLAQRGVLGALGGEQVGEHGAAGDHRGDDHHLDGEQLPGEAAQRAARGSVRGGGHADSVHGRRRKGPAAGV